MLRFASAQLDCTVGQIEQNLERHYELVEDAIKLGAHLIVFPEMSITGYCREEGLKLAFDRFDSRLNGLKELSRKGNIVVIVGAPLLMNEQLFIASFILHPQKTAEIYTKQYLHKGEELYYSASFGYNPTIVIGSESVSLAICADINQPNHVRDAKLNNSTLYIPSIFYSVEGIEEGEKTLEKYAREHAINVLMSNFCGHQWGITSGGRSAFWNSNGTKMEQLDSEVSGLLLADKKEQHWTTNKYERKEIA